MEITFITMHYIVCLCSCLSVFLRVQGGKERTRIQCSVCGRDVFRIDTHLRERHGLCSGSDDYKRARDASKPFDRKPGGPAAHLDALMEAFRSFFTSMAGGDKKETVALTIQREV